MDILLTNDDGIDAPGLQSAFEAIKHLGRIHVVAPSDERSACSHTITLRNPITVKRRPSDLFETAFAVDGTPADCVRLAWTALVDRPIKLVVSGINRGANAGVDTFYSGTVAGAREGAILGVPSIALSQGLRAGVDTDWKAASDLCRYIVDMLAKEALPGPGFWNVNLPAPVPENARDLIQRVPVAIHPTPMTFDRNDMDDGKTLEFGYGASYWLREVTGPSDYSVVRDGGVAITAIPLVGTF